jgi:hypothetical protein
MKSLIKLVFVSVLSLLSLSALAFGNEDVIKLLKADFGEDVVVNAISAANPATFDTSANGLIKLKNAGASKAIIQKMLARQNANNPINKVPMGMGGSEQCLAEAPGMENMVAVRTGGKIIGLKSQKAGVSTDVDVGSVLANVFTFGIAKAKGSSSYAIPGTRAQTRMTEKTPEFVDLFYPPGSNPEDKSVLVHMAVKEDSRVVQMATATRNISGSQGHSTTSDENIRVPVTMEKVSEICTWGGKQWTQYRMKSVAPLESGEYGFVTIGRIFDFGID